MKKTLLSAFAALSILGASALTISPAVKLNTDGPAHNPTLSPDASSLLFSSDNNTGLKALNLTDNRIVVLDDAPGAGFNPVFTTDGKSVIYQRAFMMDGLLNREVRSINLVTGKTKQIARASRNDLNLIEFTECKNYVVGSLEGITVSLNGKTEIIRPIADAHNFQWASLSPDGNRILFSEPFKGIFICDLDGSNLVNVSKRGIFPAWAGENLITFTDGHDDGYVILDSTLKVCDLTTGITINLTGEDVMVGESTSAFDGTVVYSTLDGEIFMIKIK